VNAVHIATGETPTANQGVITYDEKPSELRGVVIFAERRAQISGRAFIFILKRR
jgi:hypothetical protein